MRLGSDARRSKWLLQRGLLGLLGVATLLLSGGCRAKRMALVELQAERDSLRVVVEQLQGLAMDSEVVDILWWGVPPPRLPPLRGDVLEGGASQHNPAGSLSDSLADSVASGGVRLLRHRSRGWQSRVVQAEQETERSELRKGEIEESVPERPARPRLQAGVWGWLLLLLFVGVLAVGLRHLWRKRLPSGG